MKNVPKIAKFEKFSTESENFSEIGGGNLKQGGHTSLSQGGWTPLGRPIDQESSLASALGVRILLFHEKLRAYVITISNKRLFGS